MAFAQETNFGQPALRRRPRGHRVPLALPSNRHAVAVPKVCNVLTHPARGRGVPGPGTPEFVVTPRFEFDQRVGEALRELFNLGTMAREGFELGRIGRLPVEIEQSYRLISESLLDTE